MLNLAILRKSTMHQPSPQDQIQNAQTHEDGGSSGSEKEAVMLYTECYEARTSILGVHHPDTLGTLVGLVDCHQRTGTVTALKLALALLQVRYSHPGYYPNVITLSD